MSISVNCACQFTLNSDEWHIPVTQALSSVWKKKKKINVTEDIRASEEEGDGFLLWI